MCKIVSFIIPLLFNIFQILNTFWNAIYVTNVVQLPINQGVCCLYNINGIHFFQTYMMSSSNGNIFRVTDLLWGESTGQRWFPSQRPVTRSFGVFCDLFLNKRLSKHLRRCWFQTPSPSLWRHCNDFFGKYCKRSAYQFLCFDVSLSADSADRRYTYLLTYESFQYRNRSRRKILSISCEITLSWMPQDLTRPHRWLVNIDFFGCQLDEPYVFPADH